MEPHEAVKESRFSDEATDDFKLRTVVSSSFDHLAWMPFGDGLEIFGYNGEGSDDPNPAGSAALYSLPPQRVKGYSVMLGTPPNDGPIDLDEETPVYRGQEALDYLLQH